jgi:hypothetical protein
MDSASMSFSHMLDDAQPQSSAAFFPRSSFVDDTKALEDTFQIFLWYADAIICDRAGDILPIFR